MKNYHNIDKQKLIIFFLILATIAVIITCYTYKLKAEDIRDFLLSFGILTPIIYMIFVSSTVVFSIIFVPALWIAGVYLFGVELGMGYSFFGNLLGQTLNYLIAKKWGKPVIIKLSGEKGFKRTEKILEVLDKRSFSIMRLLDGPLTDFVSYAAGLTKITFRDYLWITTLIPIPSFIISFYGIYQLTFNLLEKHTLYWSLLLFAQVALSLIYPLYLFHQHRKK